MSENSSRAEKKVKNRAFQIAAIGVILIALILVVGSLWMGRSARESTEEAVHTVSLFYLNELADRREQVVASNLENMLFFPLCIFHPPCSLPGFVCFLSAQMICICGSVRYPSSVSAHI